MALFLQPMPPFPLPIRHRPPAGAGLARGWWLAGISALALAACEKKTPPQPPPPPAEPAAQRPAAPDPAIRQLAQARAAVAAGREKDGAPDEALAWAASALLADPGNADALALAHKLLTQTRWPALVWEAHHHMAVERIACAGDGTAWVAVGDPGPDAWHTLIRWNTRQLVPETIMSPRQDGAITGLIASPKALVVDRTYKGGSARLLCDAQTLRTVAELAPPPPGLVPEAVTVFSADGLLLAHPEAEGAGMVWRIRDSATGGLVRSSDPVGPETPAPVAAWLDHRNLRVLLRDASLAVVPVSPVEPAVLRHPEKPATLAQARFSASGTSILGLWDEGDGKAPHRRVARLSLPGDSEAGGVAWEIKSARPTDIWWRTPWAAGTSWWQSLLRDHGVPNEPPAIAISKKDILFGDSGRAPVRGENDISATAFDGETLLTGAREGRLRAYSWLPLAESAGTPGPPPDPEAFATFCAVLCGERVDPADGTLRRLSNDDRIRLWENSGKHTDLLPGTVLAPLVAGMTAAGFRQPALAAWQPLWARLARADASATSWPDLLERARSLGDSRWHQDLAEELRLRKAGDAPTPAPATGDDISPWIARRRMIDAFTADDDAAIKAELAATPAQPAALAAALARALSGDRADRIAWCLEASPGIPPFLRALGQSRIAALGGHTQEALAVWPDEFPDFNRVRALQDWDGWEQEDFATAYQDHLRTLTAALDAYRITGAADAAANEAAAKKLLEPGARATLGRRRLAYLCIVGAQIMSGRSESPELVQQLARRARDLGTEPEPCLRLEALSFTRLKRFDEAHPLWIDLIAGHPVSKQIADDYAEAAYTSLETGDPRQSMEILTSGVHRFPNDAAFAMRAGWIALLTGNHRKGYQFLLSGSRIGYTGDLEENGLLLLATSASLAGFPEEAASYYLKLTKLQSAWEAPETADALDWPPTLKAAVRRLITGSGSGQPAGEPEILLPKH